MKSLGPPVGKNYYWQIIKRHQILGTTALILVSVLGIIVSTIKNPVYEAQAKLKFKSNNYNNYLTRDNDNQQLINNLEQFVIQDNLINTEIEVIKSRPIIKKTISSLNWNEAENYPIDVETFRDHLALEKVANTNILKIKYRDNEPTKAAEAVNQLIVNYIAISQEELDATRTIIEKQLAQFEGKLEQTENAIRKIQEETDVIVPQEEAVIVATNMGTIQQKIAELQGQIASVNAKSAYIRSKLGMDSQQALAATSVIQSPEIQNAVRQLQKLEYQLAQEITRFPENNPIIQNLEEQINRQKQIVLQKIENIAGSQGITLNQAREFSNIQQSLAAELIKLEASSLGLQQEITYLLGLEQAQQEKGDLLPQTLQQLQQLQRQLGFFQTDYESLLQQIRDLETIRNPLLTNVKVISYAEVPTKPIRANYIDYLLSFALGLLMSTTAMAIAEIADTSLNTIEKAKKIFGYTWLGIIPDITSSIATENLPKFPVTPNSFQHALCPQKSPLINFEQLETDPLLPKVIVRDYPGVSASESYRMLQSNIKFLSTYKEVKVIVVTSCVSQEGKSTVAANLACAMAQAKHKVLLVDGNLHHPIQHRIWQNCQQEKPIKSPSTAEAIPNNGLSNIIEGKVNSERVIQEIFPKLDLIPSGTIPSSPATLLDSAPMKQVLDNWRQSYDFIIIDTPALDLAADAPILGRIADGVLLVVKPDSINRSQANFAKEILVRSGQNVLGIVFNQIDPQAEPKNYFYHALKERFENASKPKKIEQSKEELWLTVSRMSQESKRPKITLTPEEIISIPTEQLQEIINYLQQDLEKLTQLVKEQEEELFMQSQMVKKLQKKVNLSRDIDRPFLEQQLTQEQEHKNMLNETLIGQRRNLERKQQILRQYRQALTIKQAQ